MGCFFLLFLISIIELLLTRYVLSVLIKGSIYCAHELLESGAKTRNFHFEKNYEKWCSKICSLCFFLSTCYCKIQMYTETIRQTSLGFFSPKKMHTDGNLKLRVTGECHWSRDFMKEMVLIDIKYNINNLLVMHS